MTKSKWGRDPSRRSGLLEAARQYWRFRFIEVYGREPGRHPLLDAAALADIVLVQSGGSPRLAIETIDELIAVPIGPQDWLSRFDLLARWLKFAWWNECGRPSARSGIPERRRRELESALEHNAATAASAGGRS